MILIVPTILVVVTMILILETPRRIVQLIVQRATVPHNIDITWTSVALTVHVYLAQPVLAVHGCLTLPLVRGAIRSQILTIDQLGYVATVFGSATNASQLGIRLIFSRCGEFVGVEGDGGDLGHVDHV